MAGMIGNLVANLFANTKDFEQGMKKATNVSKSFGDRMGSLTKLVRNYWAEITVAVLAIKKLIDIGKGFLQAALDNEASLSLLNSTLKATGIYTYELSQQLQDYAAEMQKLTMYSDEQILTAQGILATFTQIGTEAYPEVIESAMNMSTIFGVDLNQAIIQLGKAINDPRMAEGLRRIGITMSQTQVDMIDNFLEMGDIWSAQRVILDELQLELGNAARAMGQTTAGQMFILRNRFDELKESIGEFIKDSMPALIELGNSLAEIGEKTIDWIYKITGKKGIQDWRKSLDELTNEEMKALQVELLATNEALNKQRDGLIEQEKAQRKAIEATGINIFKGAKLTTVLNGILKEQRGVNEELDENAIKLSAVNERLLDLRKTKEGDKKATEEEVEVNEAWEETIVLSGNALRRLIEDMDSARAGNEYLAGAIMESNGVMEKQAGDMEKIIDLMIKMSIVEYDYGVAVEQVTEKVEKLTWAEEQLKDMKWNIAETVTGSVVPAFEEFMAVTGSLSTMMKEFIKTALANLLKALAAHLAQMAVLFALGLQFGKAAAAAAGSIAAYAAASEVANMQMGGIIEQMQGMQMGGFGDIVPTMLEPGEMVIPKETVAREQPAIQEAIGGESGGQHIQIFLDGRELSGFVTKQIRNKNILVDARAVV